MLRRLSTLLIAALLALVAGRVAALTQPEALAIVQGDSDERIAALNAAAAAGDPALAAFVQALLDEEIRFDEQRVYRVQGDAVTDAVTGAAATLPEAAEEPMLNNRLRGALQAALSGLNLASPDVAQRRAAVDDLLRASLDEDQLPLVERALARESDADLQEKLTRLQATIQISSDDQALRLQAAATLAASGQPAVASLLQERLADGGETDPEVRSALDAALKAVRGRLAWGERLGVMFTGLSLGSILMLAALGLAVTYGLMGVINMAHGELIMIGAYATYVVQNLFRSFLPELFDFYVLAAIPVAFLASAAVGAVLERGVIRWLYGRPLETLLATWGISLILMQAVRSIFGAQNVAVENPSWLSGGWQVLPNLILPYNRIAIGVFAALVLAGMALLIARTRLGLFVRGVTQNRRMAACVGVHTARVDTYAFALGAGIAGLAGCALSQVGNVGPDLGQGYIVDSFMVVVLGGVGQLAGTVYAGLGLGLLNKLLEGWQGAVLAKIMVLVFIIGFIQKRPQGIFAVKGRSAEA
ncbi:MAG: urea ABC transporter permease subunit UrtB [Burkholderiaceae bacterium]|nr:urea ABC transporter permease subunit UrtB [Burkholderiaceae bacterium]